MIKRIILFGAPGSGKGTQIEVLANYFNLPKISLGDILRKEVKGGSTLGNEVKNYMDKGALVPDETITKVIEQNVNGEFILEGYPRNLSQAKNLETILKRLNIDIDAFIYLDTDEKTIVDRLSARRVCKQCGTNYHLKNMPPKKENTCDKCGSELIQRNDDKPDVIKNRWEIFLQESSQILDFYDKKGKLIKVDGRGNRDDVLARIQKIVK